MASTLGETLESLPPWVIPVAVVGVALLAALRSNGSAAGNGGGSVTTFTPVPADPNLTALAAQEVDARLGAFQAITSLVGAERVSEIAASRDTSIAQTQAEMDKARTVAALQSDLAHTAATQSVGLATVNAQLTSALDTNRTNQTVSLAELQNQKDVASINARAATDVAGTQENTAKAVSKNNLWGNIANTAGKVIGGALHLFGL